MNNENKNLNLKDRLLKDIRSGDVAMRPKFYFTLKVAALVVGVLAAVVITVFIFNFILFTIRINSQDALLGFGPRGWEAFMRFFPWHLLVLDIALVVGLQWLLRQFKFGYKIPVLYLLAGLLVAAIAAGFVLDRGTPINDRLYEMRGRGLPPPLGNFYDRARRPPPPGSGVCRCAIVSIEGNTLVVEDTRNGTTTLKVVLPMDNPRATTTNLKVGDTVFIAGEEENGVIRAFGVRKEPPGGFGPRGQGLR